MSFDDAFRGLIRLSDGFALAADTAGQLLRECERLKLPPPDEVIWPSASGLVATWEGELVYLWVGWDGLIGAHYGLRLVHEGMSVVAAAEWLRERMGREER